MRIEGIVLSCYIRDVYFTRVCVASIRYWYPHIPIWLLKDHHCGDFSTREIENKWNVQVYPGLQKDLGWGFGKLEVLTSSPARRLLLLDSDIVFAGRVIDRLEQFNEDFVVESFDETKIEEQFFSLSGLRQVDQAFEFPGYGFNTGQIVATTGKLTKQDFESLVNWQTRSIIHTEVFKMGEQGLLNYMVLRNVQKRKVTIRREPFMVWPGEASRAEHIQLKHIDPEGRQQQLIHWAGLRWGKTLDEMPRSEILLHFERMYYQRVRFGSWLKRWRLSIFRIDRSLITPFKEFVHKVLAKLK